MRKLILVVVVDVLILCPAVFAVVHGSLPILPWVPLISLILLALDAVLIRTIHLSSRDKKESAGSTTLLNGSKVFLTFLALACGWTIISSIWTLASGKGELTNLIQVVGAVVVLSIAVSAFARIRKRQSS